MYCIRLYVYRTLLVHFKYSALGNVIWMYIVDLHLQPNSDGMGLTAEIPDDRKSKVVNSRPKPRCSVVISCVNHTSDTALGRNGLEGFLLWLETHVHHVDVLAGVMAPQVNIATCVVQCVYDMWVGYSISTT